MNVKFLLYANDKVILASLDEELQAVINIVHDLKKQGGES